MSRLVLSWRSTACIGPHWGLMVEKQGHGDKPLLKENALCLPSAWCFVGYLPLTGEIGDVELEHVLISCSV